MIDIISDNIKRKARKDHKCNYCNQPILKGEKYHNTVLKYDIIYQWKSHFRCDKIAAKLRMYDRCDEGVTQDDFYEFINEMYYIIIADDTEPAKMTFKERLDIVCNHFSI